MTFQSSPVGDPAQVKKRSRDTSKSAEFAVDSDTEQVNSFGIIFMQYLCINDILLYIKFVQDLPAKRQKKASEKLGTRNETVEERLVN